MLLPFEGMGVDTVWQLELPKAANPFDYRTIADVLLTDRVHRAGQRRVPASGWCASLDRRFSGDRTFSLRNQFPDAWYELNNPDTVETRPRGCGSVLPLTADDFPPHVEDLRHRAAVAVRRARGRARRRAGDHLAQRTPPAGRPSPPAEVTTTGGIVSTRRPAGAAWHVHSSGPDRRLGAALTRQRLVRSWFPDGLIEDLVLVLTLSGTTPEWR